MGSALTNFAQDYSYYTYTSPTDESASGAMLVYFIIVGIVSIIALVSLWKVFVKAGQPGWAAIVPIYNYLILLKIVGRPWWWILLFVVAAIPFVGWIVALVATVIVANDLSKSFGKGYGMTALLVLLPFIGYPMLGFGDAKYHGPSALGTPGGMPGSTPTGPTAPSPQQ